MNPSDARDHFAEIKKRFLRAAQEWPDAHATVTVSDCPDEAIRDEVIRLLANREPARNFLTPRAESVQLGHFTGTERYECLAKLGAGGFGDVYECFDRDLREPVAVKVLRHLNPESIASFKHEFRKLALVEHHNLARLLHLEFNVPRNCWFFSMELVRGTDFLSYLRAKRGPFRETFQNLAQQLALGLVALHERGLSHGDIKPKNVLVTAEERLVILDFGLVSAVGEESGRLAGTPSYMAPEQLTENWEQETVDWYSAATMLFEALSGNLPYEGSGVELLERKRQTRAPRLEPVAGLEEYCTLCERILQPDSAARPMSEEIVATLAGRRSPVWSGYTGDDFVGRAKELRQLSAAFEATQAGKTSVVFLSGAPGMGKTALVRRFLNAKREEKSLLLALCGKCHERESIPFKAFDEVVEELAKYLWALPPSESGAIVTENLSFLGELFPALEPIAARHRLTGQGMEIADPRERRQRAAQALRELFREIGKRLPLVVFIDDLQWIDEDSVFLLSELLPPQALPPLLLVLAHRPDPVGPVDGLLSILPAVSDAKSCEIELDRLDDGDSQSLAARFCQDPARAQWFAHEGKGSPFLISQACRAYEPFDFTPQTASLAEIMRRRMTGLPESARRLLEFIAVAAAPLPLAALAKAAAIGGDPRLQVLPLVREGWVRRSGANGERCEAEHDCFRESITESMTETQLRECHGQLAVALEEFEGVEPEQVSIHFREAGDLEKAAVYASSAAERADAALAFERAARLYRFAADCGPGPWMDGGRLWIQLGEALVNAGRPNEGAEFFLKAAAVSGSQSRLELRIRAMTELLKGGEIAQGMALLRELLARVRLPMPGRPSHLLMRLIWERLRCRAAALAPIAGARALSSNERARLDTCWAAAVGTGMVDPVLTEIYCAIHLRLALRSGDSRRLALGLAAEASRAYVDDGKLKRSRKLLERSQQYAQQISADTYTRAFVEAMAAILEMLGGNWRISGTHARRAATTFREQCTAVRWETATATSFFFTSRAMLGEWLANAKDLPPLIRDAKARGDRYTAVNLHLMTSFYTSYLLTEDPQPKEAARLIDELIVEWPHQRFDIQKLYALNAQVDLSLFEGSVSEAWARVEATWGAVRASGLLRITLLKTFTVFMRARAALSLAARNGDRRLLRVVRTIIRELNRSQARYAPGLSSLLSAGLARVQRDDAQCIVILRRAETELRRSELVPWLAAAQLCMARLEPNREQAEVCQRAAFDWMHSQNFRRPECLVNMLVPGGF